jgi:transcriptional regulator with XRE-family HTH domain
MNKRRTHPRSKPLKAMPGAGPIADWLESYTAMRGLSQAQVAAFGGFSDSAVANWMRGQRPSPATLKRLADALGQPYEMLLQIAGYTEASVPEDGTPPIPPEKRTVAAELMQLPLSVLTHFALAGRSLLAAMQEGADVAATIDESETTRPTSRPPEHQEAD